MVGEGRGLSGALVESGMFPLLLGLSLFSSDPPSGLGASGRDPASGRGSTRAGASQQLT